MGEPWVPPRDLHHPAHAAHVGHAGAGAGLLGRLGDDRLGREDVLADRRGVLQRRPGHHRRVDDPGLDQVRSAAKGQGLNVDTGEVEDLVKAGIIDPTMVTRSALQNAASIGKNILTTEAIVAEAPEKAGAGAGMPDMGGMGGMM